MAGLESGLDNGQTRFRVGAAPQLVIGEVLDLVGNRRQRQRPSIRAQGQAQAQAQA